jgi:hypothetical protein
MRVFVPSVLAISLSNIIGIKGALENQLETIFLETLEKIKNLN